MPSAVRFHFPEMPYEREVTVLFPEWAQTVKSTWTWRTATSSFLFRADDVRIPAALEAKTILISGSVPERNKYRATRTDEKEKSFPVELPTGTAQRDRCSCCNADWRCDLQMSLRSQETRREKSVAVMNTPGLDANADEEQTLRCTTSV